MTFSVVAAETVQVLPKAPKHGKACVGGVSGDHSLT